MLQVMLNLEEQQGQLSEDKEKLLRELAQTRAEVVDSHEAAARRDADSAVRAQEHAAASALLANLVKTAQVPGWL